MGINTNVNPCARMKKKPKLTIVVLALLALAARADLGSNTDSLSDLELGDVLADLDDLANDFVARNDKLGLPGTPSARDGVVVLAPSDTGSERASRTG
jgi:hypothetical protein